MNDLEQLETWATPLIAALAPSARSKLLQALAVDLRRSQQRRIAQQRNPDGSVYAPRKPQREDRAGRIRRGAMFRRIRMARHLRATSNADGLRVGYAGRVARIARVHQEGGIDIAKRGGASIRYARRQLLGFNEKDRELVQSWLLNHLSQTAPLPR
ncbi:phage virion morphogenesis protein [Lysobacter gummosus]|uniref:Phage virion morphogenesis protein n=1 Tax=Lysobacter gummosus TaxID=262324 RepID=A0ABY3X9G0_9GAMM|nr:phage virion morphogenesis protein [Lysobacter gummosus]ALN92516.1 phage virion morphogenesis protein [Lysobacter gummosus]UNP28091.1 phage virion morphogenesis protein [Lysobacter gummosus]